MGTKVQHKMYMSGHYPMRDFSGDASSGPWLSHHGNRTFRPYYSIFTARPEVEGYAGYDWEGLRQTILKHETVFRQQLQELHRLYRIQTNMMNEVRSKELHRQFKLLGTSQANFLVFPSTDSESRWHESGQPSVDFGRHISSASGVDSVQSHFSSMNVKNMQSVCDTHNGSRSKEYGSLESKCKKLQRRLFDLELPADECINGEEEGQGASGGSVIETCRPNENCRVACERNGYLSAQRDAYSICNGDASSPNVNLQRNVGLTDLNEPVQLEEASSTASIDILGNVASSREETQKKDPSAISSSRFLAKETSPSHTKEKHETVSLQNLNLDNEKRRQGGLTYTLIPGQDSINKRSQNGGFPSEYLPAICESSQVASQRVDQNRRDQSLKRTIFGVEISKRDHKPCVIASDNGSSSLVHGHGIASDRPLVSNNLGLVPSLHAERSFQSGPCLVSEMKSKESQVCRGSVNSGYLNGISQSISEEAPQYDRRSSWPGNLKSAEKAHAVLPKSCQAEAIFSSKPIFDDLKKEETPKGRLSWLRDTSFCNGKYSEERDNNHQVNLNFLQNRSQKFAVKADRMTGPSQNFLSSSMTDFKARDAEYTGCEVGGCSSIRKILGVPIFEKQMSQELPSASSAPKLSCDLEFNGSKSVKAEFLLADINHDPILSDSGGMQLFDLNVSLEEEARLTHFSPRTKVKIALEIDLEAPVVLDSEMDDISRCELVESKVKESFDSLKEESMECNNEGFMKVAAEALIAMSSSDMHNIQADDARLHFKASSSDSLSWFAEIITSYECGIENGVSFSVAKDSTDFEESRQNSIDYFEFMTLNLTETELEKHHYEPDFLESIKGEVALTRRARRGQARRGRQRKDFQRDVLPGLVSLSKNDVTKDLQTIEGLVRATGGIWQSSLSQRNSPKGRGRGRKRSASTAITPTINAAASPAETAVSQLQTPHPKCGYIQHPKCGEIGFEETRLMGWGKRTRRPPRQRYPTNHPPFPLQ